MKKLYTLTLIVLFSFYFSCAQSNLWGITSAGGGPDSVGTIFKLNLDGSGFSTVHSFDTLTGYNSNGSLVMGLDGLLYGLANSGGLFSSGVIFSYDPASHNYHDVYNFNYFAGDGSPANSLIAGVDGKLYGMTVNGGINADGTIFSYDPAGDNFTPLYTFADSTGRFPYGNLVRGSDGKLYGLTTQGGLDSVGTLFSYDPFSTLFTKLHDFSHATGDVPNGTLLFANDGLLYGMTSQGGTDSSGIIFSYDLSGNIYRVVHHFIDVTGKNPLGGLIQFADGLLYGMASAGGDNSLGVIFNFDPVDTSYNDLFDFNGPKGATPTGELLAATNNKLYGMTQFGGALDAGVLFVFDPATNFQDTLITFNSSRGQYPWGNLIEVIATGITENDRAGAISIYPNPAPSELNIINIKSGMQFVECSVTNLVGQTVLPSSILRLPASINISSLAPGIYFLKLTTDKDTRTTKFIKQ